MPPAVTRQKGFFSSLLDDAYQHADQVYRNGTRFLAVLFAIALAFAGEYTIGSKQWGLALIAGLLATPLAPIAKNLSSALAAYVDALQAPKK